MPSLRQLDGRVHDEAFRACVFWRERHRVVFFFRESECTRDTRFPSPLLSLSLPTSQPQVRVEEGDTEAAVAVAWGGGGAGAAWPHVGRGEKAQLSVRRPAGRPRALLPPSPHTHFLSAWGGLSHARTTHGTHTHTPCHPPVCKTYSRTCRHGERVPAWRGGKEERGRRHACLPQSLASTLPATRATSLVTHPATPSRCPRTRTSDRRAQSAWPSRCIHKRCPLSLPPSFSGAFAAPAPGAVVAAPPVPYVCAHDTAPPGKETEGGSRRRERACAKTSQPPSLNLHPLSLFSLTHVHPPQRARS